MLQRPDDEPARPSTVCPGLHRFGGFGDEPEYDVIWWDPAALELGIEPPFGLRREELIAKDVPPEVIAEGERRYRDWRQRRDAALASGKVPALQVTTVTQWAARAGIRDSGFGVEEQDVEVVTLEMASARPGGKRFGTLVHASLSVVALDADVATVDAVTQTQGRIVSASAEEVASAAAAVRAVLAHPLIADARRAQRAGRCLRETPVAIVVDRELVEGVVDFAYEDDEGMTVIDFKTDRAEGDAVSQYRRQVGLYARAVTRATGRPARAVLMQI